MPRQNSVVLWIVGAGALILGFISVGIVGAVIYAALRYDRVPEVLVNWGGLIIGFFIGNFFSFMRSALDLAEKTKTESKDAVEI